MSSNLITSNRRHLSAVAGAVALCIAIAGTASADYAVQIGALSEPNARFADRARDVGAVTTSLTERGITRYRVGRFATKADGRTTLERLRAAGYRDAFLVTTDGASTASYASDTPTYNSSRSIAVSDLPEVGAGPPRAPAASARDLSTVPPELEDRTVVLDGRLHVMENGDFIPLSEYLRHRR